MARMKRNVGEQVSGKIGNVVFYQRYGKNYVRAAPKKRESYTDEQLLYRQRMSKASALWRSLRSDVMARIWNKAAVGMNNYAWFMKANLPALEMDGSLIDARQIKVTDGHLPVPQELRAERMPNEPNTIRVSWQNDPHSTAERLTDELMAMHYAQGKFSQIVATGLKRSALQGTFNLLPNPKDATHVFLFMAGEGGEGYSESLGMEIS